MEKGFVDGDNLYLVVTEGQNIVAEIRGSEIQEENTINLNDYVTEVREYQFSIELVDSIDTRITQILDPVEFIEYENDNNTIPYKAHEVCFCVTDYARKYLKENRISEL